MMKVHSFQTRCVAPVVVEALLEMKAMKATMTAPVKVKKEEMKVMKAVMTAPMRVKMILQMLVVLENAETPTFLMAKSSVIDTKMPVMNTLKQTQKAGVETTMKVHSIQTRCVAPVVVEALLEMKVKKEEMKVMKAVMTAPMRVKKEEMKVMIRKIKSLALVNVNQ